ncbi:MAG TPA: hypothetical protein VHE11_09895, partial [Steroidobacteraceae bacterium]|nr:hypothetical protein [Steroidobacteraceae bacterium]
QAMAVHGAIVASMSGARARPGYLASLRNLVLHVTRLDELPEDLIASAERLAGDESTALYQFAVSSAGRELLSGRAGIVFGAQIT